jgi:hypothetical protein
MVTDASLPFAQVLKASVLLHMLWTNSISRDIQRVRLPNWKILKGKVQAKVDVHDLFHVFGQL